MSDLSRRHLLALGGSAVAVAASGLSVTPTVPLTAPAVVADPVPTWIVGTPGEWDHEVVQAWTREAAIRFCAEECSADEDGEPLNQPDCECEGCLARGGFEATRVAAWDGRSIVSIGPADWLEAGFDASCSRCGDEASRRDGGHVVNREVVCSCCMTLADWDIVDPEIAAEMRADQADDPVAPTPTLSPTPQGTSASRCAHDHPPARPIGPAQDTSR